MRKSLPFDAATAAVDYQEIEHTHGGDEEQTRLVVTAVARNALAKHLKALEQAGLKVRVVDVLPLAVANAFWSVHDDPTDVMGHVLVHFQSDMCTVVIDGNMVPFYTRTIYFAAEELYGQKAGELSERERARRLMALGDELHRSLAFYEKTYQVSSFGAMHLYGGYFDTPELMEVVNRKVGLRLVASPMLERLRVTGAQIPAGKFDVALGLAMRAAAV
jgi:Tfp pilus assembly PilM family ATPase